MGRIAGLFQPARSVSVALAGGRTPVRWQHKLARNTARLVVLRRACAWVEALTEAPPKLRDEPLLGHGLAEMIEQVARPTEPKPEMVRPERPRSTWPRHPLMGDHGPASPGDGTATGPTQPDSPKDPVTRKRVPQPPGEKGLSPQPSLLPLKLDPQTSHALLARLTGGTIPDEVQDRPRREQVKALLATKRRGVPPVARDGVTQKGWLRDLARRAGRSLRQDGRGLTHTPRRASLEQAEAEQEGSPSLAEAWSVPLRGQPAPSALLAHLVSAPTGVPTGGRDGSSRETQSQTDPPRLPGTRSPEWPAIPAAGGARPWPRGGQSSVSPEGISRTEGVGTEPDSPARIAPPGVAPRLPSLLPAQMAGEPSPPMAAATIRQGAIQDETTPAEDDLSQLAAQIKRILDEEARRYGIDV